MENSTFNSLTLKLEGLIVNKSSRLTLFFFFFFFSFLFVLVTNAGMILLIFVDRNLHQPMFLLFCNLAFNDILGNCLVLPRVMSDILRPLAERLIGYHQCVVQAFLAHMFQHVSAWAMLKHDDHDDHQHDHQTMLMIMAFDRYVAICNRLHYSVIMTNRMVVKLTVSAWGSSLVLVGILLGLTSRLSRCRTLITNPYCDNASLFKLSCESVEINNIYGLTFTVVLSVTSVGSMVITYTRITAVCLSHRCRSLNSKALRTCSTNLIIYIIMFTNGKVSIALHRFPQYAEQRKLAIILSHIIPCSLNPVIYAVQSNEVKKVLTRWFQPRKVQSSV